MKKLMTVVAVAAIFLAACKKDRTCTCTSSVVSQTSTEPGYTYTPQPPTTSTTTYKKIKKSNVSAQLCVSNDQTSSYTYSSWNGTTTVSYVMTVNSKDDCKLK
jgi:hypothetical protein